MASNALRIARELRGDERPYTPRGDRPGTASGSAAVAGARGATPDDAQLAALRAELEDVKQQLEKEKRNSRSLEQYLSELNASKEQELATAVSEMRLTQTALSKAEAHALSIEDLYKSQVAKLSATVERLNGRAAAPAGGKAASVDPSDSFAAVLREEMRVMQTAFTLKLQRAMDEAATKQSEASRQNRALQEQLLEEKRKSANLLDKLARAASATSPSPSPTAAAAASAGAGSTQHFPPAPSSARTGSAGAAAPAAAAGKPVMPGSSSSRAGSASTAAAAGSGTAARPVVRSKPAK